MHFDQNCTIRKQYFSATTLSKTDIWLPRIMTNWPLLTSLNQSNDISVDILQKPWSCNLLSSFKLIKQSPKFGRFIVHSPIPNKNAMKPHKKTDLFINWFIMLIKYINKLQL